MFTPFDAVAPADAAPVDADVSPTAAPSLPVGDRAETLRALRDELADRIPVADDSVVPAMSKQLRETLAELAEIEPAAPASGGLAALLHVVEDTP